MQNLTVISKKRSLHLRWPRVLLWLDRRRIPQRVVAFLRNRAGRRSVSGYSASNHEGVHAVGLSVANPLLSTQALLADFVPRTFGSWRDFAVSMHMVAETQVVAILRDKDKGMELSLVMPRHQDFPVKLFRQTREVRLTREGIRCGLVSVRNTQGQLLAAGVLELHERAGFSYPWGSSQ